MSHVAFDLQAAVKDAFAMCPRGFEGLAFALILYDDGVVPAEAALENIRHCIGLSRPVIAGSRERGAAQAALYREQHPDTASGAAGGD